MIRPVTLIAFFALVAPAAAQSGAIVDPGSPTGKEYAIPLNSARQDAAGHSTAPGSTSTSSASQAPAPLFGEGVGTSSGAAGKAHKHASGTSTSPAKHSVTQVVAGTRSVAASVPTGDSGSTLTIIAVALAVLALGGVLGSIARRRTTTPS